MNKDAAACVVVNPGEMKVVEVFGDRAVFHLTGAQTGGKYTSFVLETPPGGGPPPHRHEREDEWFHVLKGRAEFYADGERVVVEAGGSVFAPKGSIHCFRNIGDTMLRQLIHTAPSGFEDFFAVLADEFQATDGPDMERVASVSAEFGITYPEV